MPSSFCYAKLSKLRALAVDGQFDRLAMEIDEDSSIDTRAASFLLAEFAKYGGLAYSQCLIARGADLNATSSEGVTPIANCMMGARDRRNTLGLFCYLLRVGANPNNYAHQGLTPLQVAIELNLPEYFTVLLLHGADMDLQTHDLGPNDTALSLARRYRRDWAVDALLRWHRGNVAGWGA